MNRGDVLIDFNRRTAIVVEQGRKLTHLVQLDEGELVVRTMSAKELEHVGARPLQYDTKKAVRKYLKHSGGVSAKAKAALRSLLNG